MEARAAIPVTLPRPNPSRSYWQEPPDETVANLRTTETLPATVDTAIIGSGITGCSVAWNLLQSQEKEEGTSQSILMLEARQACSGATGRNGGHTKAASYRSFPENASNLGLDEAKKIARLELSNIRAVHAFAKEKGIECDSSHPRTTVDVIYDSFQWEEAKEAVRVMRGCMPGEEDAGVYELYDDEEEVRKKFLFEEEGEEGDDEDRGGGGEKGKEKKKEKVYGGVSYEAGSLNAYKLAVGILKLCLGRGLNLQTNTAVLGLARVKGGGGEEEMWRVSTNRGVDVLAKKVVLATNGYTARLLPDVFQGVVVPLRGHVTAQRAGMGLLRPKKKEEKGTRMRETYSFIYDGGYEYMVPRGGEGEGEGDVDIVIGGGLTKGVDGGIGEYGTTDDVGHDEDIRAYLRECLPRFFEGSWGPDDPRGRMRREWTGIMGYSPDGMPFVGELPGQKDLWVCASFQGHGMVLCWMCAKALGAMMTGREGDIKDWFPEAFRISRDRLRIKFQGRLHTGPAHTPPPTTTTTTA